MRQSKNIMLLYAGLYMAPLAYPFLDMLSISVRSRSREKGREMKSNSEREKENRRERKIESER